MKKHTQFSLLLVALMVAFTGCDAAKDAAQSAADSAKDKMADMADIDFGDSGFDMGAVTEKFNGITDGFKDVTADNVDGLTSKISGLTDSMDDLGVDKLPGPAKTVVCGMIEKFGGTVETAMAGISDEGVLGKLKPVVAGLMEKINAFK